MSKVAEFKRTLERELEETPLTVSIWTGASRTSAHLISVGTSRDGTVTYVKESNSNPAFWGLTKNQLDRIQAATTNWCVILLARSHDHGYVLSARDVSMLIAEGVFELSGDGDYKVNERDLARAARFNSIREIADYFRSKHPAV